MPTADAEALKRSLHLSIEQSPYSYAPPHQQYQPTMAAPSDYRKASPPSSMRANYAAAATAAAAPGPVAAAYDEEAVSTSSSSGGDWRMFSVFCLYDFASDDPDHLSFRKNEMLDIVQTENNGWWAAVRRGTQRVGWVPTSFVQPVSDTMADTMGSVREELRVWRARPHNPRRASEDSSILRRMTALSLAPNNMVSEWDPQPYDEDELQNPYDSQAIVNDISPDADRPVRPYIGNPPTTEADTRPQSQSAFPPAYSSSPPQPRTAPVYANSALNKPTPPTPVSPAVVGRGGSTSAPGPSGITGEPPSARWPRPRAEDEGSSMLTVSGGTDSDGLPTRAPRPRKVEQITGERAAQAFVNTQAAQRAWYLCPYYVEDELRVDPYDGSVKAGTLRALVERLTVDPFSLPQEKAFRHVFLSTFRSFATANEVFALLVDRYEMDHPDGLSTEEFEDWKEKKLRPTQKRVLTCLTIWLESDMLHEDPDIANRLQGFLSHIVTPPPLALTARLILQSLERLTFALPPSTAQITSPSWRKKSKMKELLRMDPMTIAQHLTLLESRLYVQIRHQECLNWAKTQTGPTVANLTRFCATHEKLASWVKLSVLNNDALGKRADTVDFWIKVAEKCRVLNNFSTTSAITAGLTSTVVSRLHLTWAHVSRSSHLDQLTKLFEPSANFSTYRTLLASIDAPCVPFVGMYLSDMVHINDQYPDTINTDFGLTLIHFVKRERWADAMNAMLRFQKRPHPIAEDPMTMNFVEQQLSGGLAGARDPSYFWGRSQELQQAELAHADIRKGLEAAGF